MRDAPRALPVVLVALLSFLVVACGGGEEEPVSTTAPATTDSPTQTAKATPSPSPSATASATATASPAEAPQAPAVQVAPGQATLGEGLSDRALAAGELVSLDARDFAAELGVSITSCIDTTFYLTWQVREPYPPDGVDLEFYRLLRGSRELIAEGASGQLTDGACTALEMVNNSAFGVTVQLRYAFAE